MSYEVLARKWRPQDFDKVVGQEHITRTLKKAVELGRLSHAYLFSGPRGCGKTSTARILAKVINCTSLKNGNPCDECPSCVGVLQGKNLDVMEIDGASHTGVGEVRDLQESIGYVPSQFKNKIYIIDEVHMLSTHAFNALLKTLEEPPPHVYFVFATTAPHKIPDTIKSRCQRHQFKRLEVGDIADHLKKMCEAEGVAYEEDALRLLARKAEGSMRDGQSLLDQCITASSGEVRAKAVRDTLGLLDHEMVLGFLKTISQRDSTAVLEQLDAAIHEGVDLEELLGGLTEGFRDLMLLVVPGDLSGLIFRSTDELESLREVLAEYELSDLVTIVERLCNLSPRLKMASDPRILLESVLVDLALLDRQVEIRELIDRLRDAGTGSSGAKAIASKSTPRKQRKATSRSEEPASGSAALPDRTIRVETEASARAGGGPFPEPVSGEDEAQKDPPQIEPVAEQTDGVASIAPPRGSDVDLAALGYADQRKLWESFATCVRQKKVTLGVCLLSGTLQSIENDVVVIRYAKGFSLQKEEVENAANKKFLKTMTKRFFGRELGLSCVGADSRGKRTVQRTENREGVEANPLAQKIINAFDGEIVRYPRP